MAPTKESDASPIFVVGAPRSGTSVLTWALGQHPRVLPLEEGDWLCKLAVNLSTIFVLGVSRGERSQFSSMGITPHELYSSVGEGLNRMLLGHRHEYERLRAERGSAAEKVSAYQVSRKADDPKVRYVDGTPEYSNHILALSWLFPEARFIHIARDAHSVARSLVNFDSLGQEPWTWEAAYEKWLSHVRACLDGELALGSEVVLRVRHQDLRESPEEVLRRCLGFVGEDYSPDCLEPLGLIINTSAPDGSGEAEPGGKVRTAILEEATSLSDSVLAERAPRYRPNRARVGKLEAQLRRRMKGLEMMYARQIAPPSANGGSGA